MPSLKPHGQMSEAFITALFLSVSGGLQDVYTYLYRGKVFANAQTGNIVLMAVRNFRNRNYRKFFSFQTSCEKPQSNKGTIKYFV